MEYEHDPVKVVLAVDDRKDAMIFAYLTTHAYDHWFDEGAPYAVDNGFSLEELPKEPGLYNCTAQPRWDGTEEDGELRFDITSIETAALFAFKGGEGAAVVELAHTRFDDLFAGRPLRKLGKHEARHVETIKRVLALVDAAGLEEAGDVILSILHEAATFQALLQGELERNAPKSPTIKTAASAGE
jgi:hypothetical protein